MKTLNGVFILALVSVVGGGIKVVSGAWNTLIPPTGAAAGLGSVESSENTSLGDPLGVNTFEKTFGLASSSGTDCRLPALFFSVSFERGTEVGVGAPGSLEDRARRLTSGVTKGSGSMNGLNCMCVK